jgi:hypothetical protein
VEVYPDTGRVVVTGSVDAAEVVTALEIKLRVTVTIVCRQEPPQLKFSSDDEDDNEEEEEEDDEESSGDQYYYEQTQPENLEHWGPWNPDPDAEWYGMGFPAIRTREPRMADEPVPDPAPWFYNFSLAPQEDDHRMGSLAIRTQEPWMADEPVPDPTPWFYNFSLAPQEDDDHHQ